jgi:hypothetical protein
MAVAKATAARTSSMKRQQHARVDGEHGATELVVPREEIAEPIEATSASASRSDVRTESFTAVLSQSRNLALLGVKKSST